MPGGHNFRSSKMLLGVKCYDVKAELVIFLLKQLIYLKSIPHNVFNSLQGLFGQRGGICHFAKIRATFHSLFYSCCRPLIVVVVV